MSVAAIGESACTYCGLPAPRPPVTGLAYCCFGCRFADAMRPRDDEGVVSHRLLARLGLAVFLTFNVLVCTMVLWSEDLYVVESSPLADVFHGLLRHASLVLALPVFWLLGIPLFEHAWAQLRDGQWTTDLLLLTGVAAAFAISIVALATGRGHVYFEVACVILVLVTLGRWLEARGRAEATAALNGLQRLLPETARVVAGDEFVERSLAEVRPGDCVLVRQGEHVPCDGRVTRHEVEVDEQIVTGESIPRVRGVGERVWSGTRVLTSELWLDVDSPAEEGLLPRMLASIRQALARKSRFQRQADRLASVLMPTVALAAVAAGAWHGVARGWDAGVMTGLAVVVIACPCALGLATPLATWTAIGKAGQTGILLRNGEYLERLAGVRAIRFDKTGTLTTGRPRVEEVTLAEGVAAPEALALAWKITTDASHTYAQAIHDHLPAPSSPPPLAEIAPRVGRGITAHSPTHGTIYLGSPGFLEESGQVVPLEWKKRIHGDGALAVVLLAWGGHARVWFGLAEDLRPGVHAMLDACKNLGLDVAVLTGDRAARAQAMAHELRHGVQGELLPEDKVAAVAAAGKEFGPVAMVGDGLNDAAALAASDVGIAMGCGADLTRDAAGVCLLGNDLAAIPRLVRLARQTVRTIRFNLFWACAYNFLGIALASTGRLNPVWAAVAMVLSSAFVVGNSLRLRQAGMPGGSTEVRTS